MSQDVQFYDCEETSSHHSQQQHAHNNSGGGGSVPSMYGNGGGGLPPRSGSVGSMRGQSPGAVRGILPLVPPNQQNHNSVLQFVSTGGPLNGSSTRAQSASPGGMSRLSGGSFQYHSTNQDQNSASPRSNLNSSNPNNASVQDVAARGAESPILGERADALQHQYKMEKSHRQFVQMELQQKTLDVDYAIEKHIDKVKGHYEERIRQLENAVVKNQQQVDYEKRVNQQQRDSHQLQQKDQQQQIAMQRQSSAASRGLSPNASGAGGQNMQGNTVVYGERGGSSQSGLFNNPNNRSNLFAAEQQQPLGQQHQQFNGSGFMHPRGGSSIGQQQSPGGGGQTHFYNRATSAPQLQQLGTGSPHRDGSFQQQQPMGAVLMSRGPNGSFVGSAPTTGHGTGPHGSSFDLRPGSPLRNPYGNGTGIHSFSDSIGSPTHWQSGMGNYYDSVLQRVRAENGHGEYSPRGGVNPGRRSNSPTRFSPRH